jgi:hypothetical protein
MQSRVLSRAASLKEECTDAYGLLRALLTDRGTDDCSVASEATEQVLLRCQATALEKPAQLALRLACGPTLCHGTSRTASGLAARIASSRAV